jgi:uncharacterized protein YcfJ
MNKLILASVLGASTLTLGGCGSSSQVGTVTGAAAGAGLGYVVGGGNALGTVIGAGAGALIGNEIGRSSERRMYRNSYYRNGGYYYY